MLGFLFRKVLLRMLMAMAVPLALIFARCLVRDGRFPARVR